MPKPQFVFSGNVVVILPDMCSIFTIMCQKPL